jgi:hypothetical protein
MGFVVVQNIYDSSDNDTTKASNVIKEKKAD